MIKRTSISRGFKLMASPLSPARGSLCATLGLWRKWLGRAIPSGFQFLYRLCLDASWPLGGQSPVHMAYWHRYRQHHKIPLVIHYQHNVSVREFSGPARIAVYAWPTLLLHKFQALSDRASLPKRESWGMISSRHFFSAFPSLTMLAGCSGSRSLTVQPHLCGT